MANFRPGPLILILETEQLEIRFGFEIVEAFEQNLCDFDRRSQILGRYRGICLVGEHSGSSENQESQALVLFRQ